MNKDSPEINELPDLENQNFDKKFRRTNDAVQYQVFVSILKAYEKTLNLLKYTLLVMIVAIIFVYNSFSNNTTGEDYQIRMLNDIILKLDDLKKNQIGTNTNQIDKTKILERIIICIFQFIFNQIILYFFTSKMIKLFCCYFFI